MSDLLNKASLVVIPSGYKEDTVYSVVPSDGAGDLSFTRASNGTRVNSAGLVEVCPWNLCTNSEDQTQWTSQNATTVTANSTTAPNGTLTADTVTPTAVNDDHYRGIVLSSQVGELTAFIYVKPNGYNFFDWGIYNGSSYLVRATFDLVNLTYTFTNAGTATIESVGNGWLKCGISGSNASLSTIDLYYRVRPTGGAGGFTGNGTSGAFIWGAQLNIGSTAKPYFPTTDRLNVPRLTYQNGGGGCPSLLLEKQSTNLITYSEDFTNAVWLKAGGNVSSPTVTANQITSPDGTQNADKIVFPSVSNTGDFSLVYRNAEALSGSNTTSVYLKGENGGEKVYLFYIVGSTYSNKLCTLTTEWQRFDLTFTGGLISFWHLGVDLRTGSGQSAQSAQTIYAWGAQLEASTYATSYIPTTAASATRVADGPLNLSTTQTLTNFTLFYDGLIFQNGENMLFGSGNSAWYIDVDGSNGRVVLDLTSGRIYTGFNAGITTNQRFKLAIKRSAGVVDAFVNGTKLTPTTQVTDTTSLTLSSITWGFSSTQYPKMKVNEICAFQSALSDADCQALTTI